jgi:hypothetical protein
MSDFVPNPKLYAKVFGIKSSANGSCFGKTESICCKDERVTPSRRFFIGLLRDLLETLHNLAVATGGGAVRLESACIAQGGDHL